MREIIRLTAPTTAATTGTFVLTDPNYFYAGATSFRLPLGCKAKLWGYTLSGTAFIATMSVSHDTGSTYAEAAQWNLVADGNLAETYDGRPEVFLESRAGTEMFKVDWSQASAVATSRLTLLIEISDED